MFYQSSKTARAAAIGTIMPWTGGIGNVPKGWIVCEGSVQAVEYPLLAQAIGDTYNGGASTFAGSFPAYTGQIKLPDLNDKTLMDIEQSYFSNTAPRAIDRDKTGSNIIRDTVSNLVGLVTSNIGSGISNVFNDKYTDIIFDIPNSDRGGYAGKITGNTIIPGEADKVVYVAPRKLSRNHLTAHRHPGSYPTIASTPESFPGKGVLPYQNVTLTRLYTFSTTEQNKVFPGFSFNLYPVSNAQLDKTGWGNGQPGRTMGGISRESPPINMKPFGVLITPIAPNFSNVASENRITGSTSPDVVVSLPYGLSGANVSVPAYAKNYYTGFSQNFNIFANIGQDDMTRIYAPPGPTDPSIVVAHDHDEIEISFVQGTSKALSSMNAIGSLSPGLVLGNAENKGALQINFNTSQPSMSCLYIIRAY